VNDESNLARSRGRNVGKQYRGELGDVIGDSLSHIKIVTRMSNGNSASFVGIDPGFQRSIE
jgi:hypothetical protein